MDNDKMIPYIAYEAMAARQERTIKRLWILCIILIVSLIGTNAGWIYYESQWSVVENSTEVTQQLDAGDGGNAIINDGVHINGESTTDDQNNN